MKNAYQRFAEEGIILVARSKDQPKTPATMRLAAEWTPQRCPTTGKLSDRGRLWDFTEKIAQSRREGCVYSFNIIPPFTNANVVQKKPSRRSNSLFPCPLHDRHRGSTTIPKRSPICRDRSQCVDTQSPKNRYRRESELVKQSRTESGKMSLYARFSNVGSGAFDEQPPSYGWLYYCEYP